ncbi:hypothetical protein [Brevundimonas sp. GCM10030266]|uniref:hypothetical protein n=1 Tax=Brevundimonas sp. GCM10030266 TaxID=3273386 RepID=UPI0036238195
MNTATVRLCGYAGLIGAFAMFVGDMLFYGQFGSGNDALSSSLDVVRRTDPDQLALGGLTSVVGGFGYALGAGHVYGRMAVRHLWLRVSVAGAFLLVAVIATATHAVWGSFALALVTASSNSDLVGAYLSKHFLVGGLVGVPASLLLAAAILTRATNWPIWFAVVSPGAIYLLLSNATYLPAPLGAPIVGGAFNLAFAFFYGASVAHSHFRTSV